MKRIRRVVLVLAMMGSLCVPEASAQDDPGQYIAKAKFLSIAPGFVEWPTSAFKNANSPLQICVHGDFSFGTSFGGAAARSYTCAPRRRKRRTDHSLGDIDHFKKVNDTFGRATGDDVLREVASRLGGSVRTYDAVSRYGEEFLIVLNGCRTQMGANRAENIRLARGASCRNGNWSDYGFHELGSCRHGRLAGFELRTINQRKLMSRFTVRRSGALTGRYLRGLPV